MTGAEFCDGLVPPFSSLSPRGAKDSRWRGKPTAAVYDAEGRKVCVVPAFPERANANARRLAERLADALNRLCRPSGGTEAR